MLAGVELWRKDSMATKVRMLMFQVFSCTGSAGASRAVRGRGLLCWLRGRW